MHSSSLRLTGLEHALLQCAPGGAHSGMAASSAHDVCLPLGRARVPTYFRQSQLDQSCGAADNDRE